MSLKYFQPDSVPLAACGSWPESHYLLDKRSAYALEMALLTQRPLLVKGEPGLGKSYLARAAATQLNRAFIAEVININTQGQELLWQDNPIARLSDAQLRKKTATELHPKHYINPGVLWWAFDWDSADKHYNGADKNSTQKGCYYQVYKPHTVDQTKHQNGIVLLIDEIDKADPSLPNSLLEVLGNGGFDVPLLNETIGKNNKKRDSKAIYKEPLVIITTNNERELPPAFVRRCLVLQLKVDEENIVDWLIERSAVHDRVKNCSLEVKKIAAEQLKKDRIVADKQGLMKAGLSEYIDLLTALCEMTEGKKGKARQKAQLALLDEIKDFAFCKADL